MELAESSVKHPPIDHMKDNISKEANMISLFDKLIKLSLLNKDNRDSTNYPNLCSNKSLDKCVPINSDSSFVNVAEERPQTTSQDDMLHSTQEASLFNRITSQDKQKDFFFEEISKNPDKSLYDHKQNTVNTTPEHKSWKKLLSESSMEGNIIQMVELISTTNDSISVDTKLNILACLSEKCAKHHHFYKQLGSSCLVYYTGELLLTYSDTLTKYNSDHTPIVPPISVLELQLLTPILKLLIPVANMSIQMVRSVFLHQSDVLSQLMRAASLCAYNVNHVLKRIEKLTQGKSLVCASLKMTYVETKIIFEKCFGINLRNICVNLVGYNIIIYDTTDDAFDLNINEEIIKTLPLKGIAQASFVDIDNDYTNVDKAEWTDVVVIRTFPPKYMLMYLKAEWQALLVDISAQLYKIKISDMMPTETFQQEDIVGFSTNDATLEGNALLTVPYLRGQVMVVTGDRVMLWAMDVGLLCYIAKEKLFSLEYTTVITEAPLVNIGVLQGPICIVDEDFLKQTFNLLRAILESNAQSGKYMLLCDSGADTLIFFEYPNVDIRIPVLDILLTLANNCKEVQKFMEKNKFDLFLTGKLERYAHSYRSSLYTNEAAFKTETFIMSKILCTLLENKLDIKDWPGNEPASKAFKILREDHHLKWRKLFDRCLYLLGRKCVSREHDLSRWGHGGWRQRYNRQGSYCSRLPRHNTLFQSKRTDYNDHTLCYDQYQDSCHHQYQDLKDRSSENKVETVKDNDVRIMNIQTDYFIRGSKVDVRCGQTYHLMEVKTLYQLKEIELSQILCGLLNNNVESSMYFGLSLDSIVEGMLLTREDKDVFRNGIDRIMNKCLLPEVRIGGYDITFTPVLKPKDKVVDIPKTSLYIIEISVRPLMHMAYVLYQGRKCYMRHGTITVEWTAMQKKNYMIELEEKELKEAIESFKEGYKGNLTQLAAFVKKYLPPKDEAT